MKTAEEILFPLIDHIDGNQYISLDYALEAIKEYAKQVAKKALEDATEIFDEYSFENDSILIYVKSKIETTPIQLP